MMMRLLDANIPHELIQELHEGEITVILALLRARERRTEEEANANRR